jgi:hypothetical protein
MLFKGKGSRRASPPPKEVVAKLNGAMREALADAAVQARFTELGLRGAARPADAGGVGHISAGRDRQVMVDHQGRQHQRAGAVKAFAAGGPTCRLLPNPRSSPSGIRRRRKSRSELGLEHLAVIVFRQFLFDDIEFRPLEAGDVLKAVAIKVGSIELGASLGHNEGDNIFTPFGAWPSHNRDLKNPRMQKERFLYLAWIDIRAAGNDDILRSVFQREKAVIVH